MCLKPWLWFDKRAVTFSLPVVCVCVCVTYARACVHSQSGEWNFSALESVIAY